MSHLTIRAAELQLNAILAKDEWPEYPTPSREAPIIFADFDGVFNSDTTAALPLCLTPPVRRPQAPIMGLDPTMIRRLNRLCSLTGGQVVLSTTWYMSFGAEGCEVILRFYGFEGKVVGHTPRKMSSDRVTEILLYLNERRPHWYVILDDEAKLFRRAPPRIKDHLVLTDGHRGITDNDVSLAVSVLTARTCE